VALVISGTLALCGKVSVVRGVRVRYMPGVTTIYSVTQNFTPKGAYWPLAQGVVLPGGQLTTNVSAGPGHVTSGFAGPTIPATCQAAGQVNSTLACMARLGYRSFATYQPGYRFWPFQFIETGIFVALAVAFGVVLFLRNRNWGAIALGILALKPTAMLGPMLMVYPERFGVWLRLFISGVIVAFAPFLWLGFGSMRHWLTILFDRASTDIAGGHYYNQGLSSLAGRSNALIIIGGCIVLIAAALLTEQVRKNLGLHASIAFAVTLGCLVNPHSLLYDWGTAFVIVFLVRKAIHLSDIPADFLSGLFMISLFVAGQLTWHYRTHDFGIQPLTAWGILVAFGILVGTFWPRKERPAEVTTTPAELQPAS